MESPKEVLARVDTEDFKLCLDCFSKALKEITSDSKMSDARGNYFHIIIQGEFTKGVQDKLNVNVKEFGWKGVECTNTSENNERAGLMGIKLYF